MAAIIATVLLFAQIAGPGIGKGKSGADFLVRETVPQSGLVVIDYNSLHIGLRYDFDRRTWMVGDREMGPRGGCSFEDLTDAYSPVRVIEDAPEKLVIRATPGHRIQYRCNWIVPN